MVLVVPPREDSGPVAPEPGGYRTASWPDKGGALPLSPRLKSPGRPPEPKGTLQPGGQEGPWPCRSGLQGTEPRGILSAIGHPEAQPKESETKIAKSDLMQTFRQVPSAVPPDVFLYVSAITPLRSADGDGRKQATGDCDSPPRGASADCRDRSRDPGKCTSPENKGKMRGVLLRISIIFFAADSCSQPFGMTFLFSGSGLWPDNGRAI